MRCWTITFWRLVHGACSIHVRNHINVCAYLHPDLFLTRLPRCVCASCLEKEPSLFYTCLRCSEARAVIHRGLRSTGHLGFLGMFLYAPEIGFKGFRVVGLAPDHFFECCCFGIPNSSFFSPQLPRMWRSGSAVHTLRTEEHVLASQLWPSCLCGDGFWALASRTPAQAQH